MATDLPIGKKVIKDLFREKTILFTVFLQLFIIIASSVVITNSNVLFNHESIISTPIIFGFYDSFDSNVNVSELSDSDKTFFKDYSFFMSLFADDMDYYLTIKELPDKETALDAFYASEVDVIVNFKNDVRPYEVDLYFPKGDIKTSTAVDIVKEKLTLFEDELRHEDIEDLVKLSLINTKSKASNMFVSIYEALYEIMIPFILLLPGILLGGLLIDIIYQDLETKTINLLMIATTFKRYIYEILSVIMGISIVQVLIWELLLVFKKIQIANIPFITSLIVFVYLIMFIIAILLVIIIKDKTRSQITYSFFVIILFLTAPLLNFNPIRVITRLSIGLIKVPIFGYYSFLLLIITLLLVLLNYVIEKMEW